MFFIGCMVYYTFIWVSLIHIRPRFKFIVFYLLILGPIVVLCAPKRRGMPSGWLDTDGTPTQDVSRGSRRGNVPPRFLNTYMERRIPRSTSRNRSSSLLLSSAAGKILFFILICVFTINLHFLIIMLIQEPMDPCRHFLKILSFTRRQKVSIAACIYIIYYTSFDHHVL